MCRGPWVRLSLKEKGMAVAELHVLGVELSNLNRLLRHFGVFLLCLCFVELRSRVGLECAWEKAKIFLTEQLKICSGMTVQL